MAEKNPLVQIAGVVGGMSVSVVALVVIFAKEQLWVAAVIVGGLVAMGVLMGVIAACTSARHRPEPPRTKARGSNR